MALKEIILLLCSIIAASGAFKILWPRKVKPKLVNPELFIKFTGSSAAKGALLLKCIIINNGSKLCSVENVNIKFADKISLNKGGCVHIEPNDENKFFLTSTKLPINIPADDGAEKILVVGHIGDFAKCPSQAKVEIEFSGKTASITKTILVNERDIIEIYENTPR